MFEQIVMAIVATAGLGVILSGVVWLMSRYIPRLRKQSEK